MLYKGGKSVYLFGKITVNPQLPERISKLNDIANNIDLFAQYGVGLQILAFRFSAGITNRVFNTGDRTFAQQQKLGYQFSLSFVGGKRKK